MNVLKKIIEYGLYLLVFILPWQTRLIIRAGELNGGYWEYGTMSLYGTDILLMILLMLAVFKLLLGKKNVNPSSPQYPREIKNYWWIIAGLELFIFISVFFAIDRALALFYYSQFLLGVGFFWLIISANFNKFKLIISLILGIFLQAVLGIWQFLSQASFASKWLGMAIHNAGDLGVSVIETGAGERWLRAYGGLDHPNMFGGLLVIGLLLAIYLILSNKKMNYELRITNYGIEYLILYFFILTFITALFFSFSRGAWLASVVGVAIMLGMALKRSDWLAQKKILKVILFSGILIFIMSTLFQNLTDIRTRGKSRLEVKSNFERIESYKTAGQVIKKNWLFGTSIGNYTLAVHDEINSSLPSYAYQPTHDVFLLVFAEIGIFGFLFFVGLLLHVLITNYELRITNDFSFKTFKIQNLFKIQNYLSCGRGKLEIKKFWLTDKYFQFLNISILVSLLIIMSVDHWFWSLHFGVLLFWLVIGLAIRQPNE